MYVGGSEGFAVGDADGSLVGERDVEGDIDGGTDGSLVGERDVEGDIDGWTDNARTDGLSETDVLASSARRLEWDAPCCI
jgi:hypothetical protein